MTLYRHSTAVILVASILVVAGCSTSATTRITDAPLDPRAHGAIACTGTDVYVWGGASLAHTAEHQYETFADGATYDVATHTWTELPEAPLTPRWGPSATVAGDTVVVWGGTDGTYAMHEADSNRRNAIRRNDGAVYRIDDGEWEPMAESPLPGRFGPTLVAANDTVLVYIEAPRRGDSAVYDTATNSWTAVDRVPKEAVVVTHNTTFIAIGPDGIAYLDGTTWTTQAPAPDTESPTGAAVIGDTIVVTYPERTVTIDAATGTVIADGPAAGTELGHQYDVGSILAVNGTAVAVSDDGAALQTWDDDTAAWSDTINVLTVGREGAHICGTDTDVVVWAGNENHGMVWVARNDGITHPIDNQP